MAVANSNDWQSFSSGPTTLQIRVVQGNSQTQGRAFVLMDDIADVFPTTLRLQNGSRVVGLMIDCHGHRLVPFRIENQPGSTIQVITREDSTLSSPSPPILLRPASQKGASKLGPLKILDITSKELTEHPTTLRPPRLSSDVTSKYRRSAMLYENFLHAVRNGQTEHSNTIRDDFRNHFTALEGEMAKNADLQQQMFEMQQSMVQMQQQSLDRLALIQNRVQAILVQNYELHEYPIPRLFIVLPKDFTKWDPSRLIQNTFRLHFLCECGEHTRSGWSASNGDINSINDDSAPHHIHLAKHEGYDLESPSQFFLRYGPYVLDMLNLLKYGTMVAGLVVPALVPLKMTVTVDQLKGSLNHFAYNIEPSINQAIDYLQALSTSSETPKNVQDGVSNHTYADTPEALEGADLRRLGMFLKDKDKDRVLGNLYRMVTSEGHVKWVCLDHYRSTYNNIAVDELKEVIQVNGGSFEEHTGRVEISLSSSIIAGQFYRAMERGRFIQELKVALAWTTNTADSKALLDAIHRSNIVHLDLTCATTLSTGGLLSRTKASNPLWEMITGAKLQTLILSNYQGFFVDTPRLLRTTNLRVLKLSERVRWKKEGAKLIVMIKESLKLSELSFKCPENDISEAFVAIADAIAEGTPLQRLEIKGEFSYQLVVRFEQGRPVSVVSITSNPSLIPAVNCLRSLHVRPLGVIQPDMEQVLLSSVIPLNPSLANLKIRCHPSRFLHLFQSITAPMDSNLKSLCLYDENSHLTTPDIRDAEATVLELSSEITGFSAEPLLKAYGRSLTKLRIASTRRNQQPFWNESMLAWILWQSNVSKLAHLELTCSSISLLMVNALDLILKHHSLPGSMSEFVIEIDIPWREKSQVCTAWVKFIVEYSRQLTMVKIDGDVDFTSWMRAIQSLGKVVMPFTTVLSNGSRTDGLPNRIKLSWMGMGMPV
ncbi:hypothetical protein BGZ96_002219 [Linnemannia gamsii]|uniref:Uncharacterized protein n=1 Tax=Linnemannia gamsii TaxID=64522 RepID=A0ABQ7KAV0_9FUNG|nr:hypothetical protein BGZ96_002219 [Linnemannia gamsii]